MPAFTTLGAVERDEDLLSALARLAEAGPGWFTASGYVTDVELRLPSPEGFALRQLTGSYALVHLAGVSTGPFFVMLTRGNGDGVEAWGGELVRARSLGVHVAAHPGRLASAPTPTDVPAVVTPRMVEPLAPAPIESPAPASRASAAVGLPKPAWAMAAAASARSHATATGDADDPELPEVGDLVDHFAFGRCEVVASEGDRLKLRDVKAPGRVREVSVEMLRVMAPTQVEGRRVFPLARRVPT